MARKRPREGASPGASSRTVVAAARGKGAGTRRRQSLWEFIRGLLPAVVIFLVIRTFFIEAFRIPSESMEPTLLVGDFLFVNKLIYGPAIPFTRARLPGYAEPERGQVAIYVSPPQAGRVPPGSELDDNTPTVVKRIVALGGDTIYMRGGLLYVNGIAQRQGYGAAGRPEGWVDEPDPYIQWTTERGLRGSRFGAPPARASHDTWGPIVVPAGHFFSLGDNRYNSVDARYYGFVPRENLRGKPLFIYYSHDCRNSDVGAPACFVTDVRWSRIGDRIR